jgi:hypothetical protein
MSEEQSKVLIEEMKRLNDILLAIGTRFDNWKEQSKTGTKRLVEEVPFPARRY